MDHSLELSRAVFAGRGASVGQSSVLTGSTSIGRSSPWCER